VTPVRRGWRALLTAAAGLALLGLASAAAAQDWDRARALYEQKQYREAITAFQALVQARPEYWQAWYYVGASQFQLEHYPETIDAFRRYLAAAGDSAREQATGEYFLGFAHYKLQQYAEAIPHLDRYITLAQKSGGPVEPASQSALGRAYIFTERFADAVPVLTAAAAGMPGNANNHYYLGYAYRRLGRAPEAVTALKQALALLPQDADSLLLLGDVYLQQAREDPAAIQEAIAVGERLAPIRDDQATWGLLGQAYLADKQFAKAAPLLDRYARVHPGSAAAWFNLGLARSRSGEWAPAAAALEEAIRLKPEQAAALLELGYVFESDRQPDKALKAYERAWEASGLKDETARQGVDRLRPKTP
jgi:tetratricopeptide (TPR) repeat protein